MRLNHESNYATWPHGRYGPRRSDAFKTVGPFGKVIVMRAPRSLEQALTSRTRNLSLKPLLLGANHTVGHVIDKRKVNRVTVEEAGRRRIQPRIVGKPYMLKRRKPKEIVSPTLSDSIDKRGIQKMPMELRPHLITSQIRPTVHGGDKISSRLIEHEEDKLLAGVLHAIAVDFSGMFPDNPAE